MNRIAAVRSTFSTGRRWLAVPWHDWAVALVLVAAAGALSFLAATADIWRVAAGDEITARLVDVGQVSDRWVAVETNALFTTGGSTAADSAVRETLAEFNSIGEPVETLSTARGLASVGRSGSAFNTPVRLVHHTGALNAVNYVRHLPDEFTGAWISSWLAEKSDIEIGDTIVFYSSAEPEVAGAEVAPGGGSVAEILVVGIYEPVWTEDGSPLTSDSGVDAEAFWGTAPPELRPHYVRPFRGPSFALVLVDKNVMQDLGVTGTARWAAKISETPQTRADLESLVSQVRGLELALVQDRSVSDALDRQAGFEPATPKVISTLPSMLSEVLTALEGLAQPLGSAKSVGTIGGLFVMAAAAAFAVDRRRQEFRLLAGEGDRFEQFAGRAAAQLTAPVLVGTVLGVAVAAGAGMAFGPSEVGLSFTSAIASIDTAGVVMLAPLSIGVGAIVTGLLGPQSQRQPQAVGRRSSDLLILLIVVGGATGFLWFDVRSITPSSGVVDLSLVALPIAALASSALVALLLLDAIFRRWSPGISRLPNSLFFALKRVVISRSGTRMVIVGVTVSLGFIVFASTLAGEVERIVDRKLDTELGGETLVDLIGRPGESISLGPNSTVVGYRDSRVTPGNRRVRVVAVDPATAAGAISWTDSQFSSLDEILELLETDTADDVAAIAIGGQSLPTSGSFGVAQPFRYRIVASVDSIPLAASLGSSLLVSANSVDAFALERAAQLAGAPVDDPGLLATFVAPTSRYRQNLVSQEPASNTEAVLVEQNVRYRSITSATERRADPDLVGPRFAFGYMRWLGLVAAAFVAASLLLYLAAQRSSRALSSVILSRMGLSDSQLALTAATEAALLTAVGLVAAFVVAPAVIAHTLPRFDPAPSLPPRLSLDFPISRSLLLAIAVLIMTFMSVWNLERRANRRSQGEILRNNG